MLKYLHIVLLLLAILFAGCRETTHQQPKVTKADMKNSMEKANRYLLSEEEQDIENYIARHELQMVSTGTGLRYQIVEQGSDKPIRNGQKVSIAYELRSIAGDMIYSSETEGIKTFVVGDGQVESGLEEAMLHLHEGDKAKIIIPYHLGYGLHGDDNKIPEYATLVYTIKLIDNQ